MRLYLYYALHSFKNQLKKIFKSWVIIMVVSMFALGVVAGECLDIGTADGAELFDGALELGDDLRGHKRHVLSGWQVGL